MGCLRGRWSRAKNGVVRFVGVAGLLLGVVLFGAIASARQHGGGHAAAANPTTTWTLVTTDCSQHQGSVQVGHACWDQQANNRPAWTVSDGSATESEPK